MDIFRADIGDVPNGASLRGAGYFSGILETCRMARLYAGRDIMCGI